MKMIDHNLISNIALGDIDFERKILHDYEFYSQQMLKEGSLLLEEKSWTIMHLKIKEYRNKVAPFLKNSSLTHLNAVLEILLSTLNSSAKQFAYLEFSNKIKRELYSYK